MAIFDPKKKKEEELGVSAAPDVSNAADTSAAAAAQANADAAAQSQAAVPSAAEATKARAADLRAQEMGMRRTIAEHSKGVGYETVELGEYKPREGMSQTVADQINKANKEGDLRHGQSNFGVENQIVVDYSTIKSPKQAAWFGMGVPEEDREKYAKQYAKATGQDVSAVIEQFEGITGDRFFTVPKSNGGKVRAANKALGEYGLVNAANQPLDIAKATPQQVIQSLHMNPDDDTRKKAFKAIQILQKTPGSAWYGMELTQSDLGFMDSAELTKSEYNEEVSAMEAAFTFADKPSEANIEAYLTMRNDLKEAYADSPRVLGYMLSALDKTYSARNGGYVPPDAETADKILQGLKDAGMLMTDVTDMGKKKTRIAWGSEEPGEGGIVDAVTGATVVPAFETYKKENGAQDVVDEIGAQDEAEYLGGRVTVDEEGNATYHGPAGDVEIGKTGTGGGSSAVPAAGGTVTVNGQQVRVSAPLASAGTMHGLTRDQLFPDAAQEEGFTNPLGLSQEKLDAAATPYGPQQRELPMETAADRLIAAAQPSVVKDDAVPYNPEMTDAQAMLAYLGGQTMDARNEAQIERFKSKQSMDVINAALGGYSISDVYSGEAGYGSNTLANDIVYGNGIASAMRVLGTGAMDNETAVLGAMMLADVVGQINAAIENTNGLIIPNGANQYDHVLSMRKDLRDQVMQVNNLLVDQGKAEGDAVRERLEESKAIYDGYLSEMAKGNGTPEMLAALALHDEQAYTDGSVEDAIFGDEGYNGYMKQLSERGDYWKDGGAYWQTGSAAAQEAQRLYTTSGYKGAYREFKKELTSLTSDMLWGLSEDAHKNNVSLNEWLAKGGVTSLDQIVDMAFCEMVRAGAVLANDPQAQAAMDEIGIGIRNAAALGGERAVKKTGEGLTESAQMVVDEAAHAEKKYDIRHQFEGQYGEFGRRQCRGQLIALANSGELSEESKAELLEELKRNPDVYDVAAYYLDMDGIQGWLHTTANDMQKDIENIDLIAARLPETEKKAFNTVNGLASTGMYMGVGAVATLAFAPAGIGALAGAAVPAFGGVADNFERYYYGKNASRSAAWFMTGAHWATETAMNYGGAESMLDDLTGGENFVNGLGHALKGKHGAETVAVAAKYGVARTGARMLQEGGEELGEAVVDMGLELTFDVIDKEIEAAHMGADFSPARTLTYIADTITEHNPEAVGKELLDNFGAGAVMGGIFGLCGTMRLSAGVFRDYGMLNTYDSVKMANQIYNGEIAGNEENIGALFIQMREDLKDPRFRKWLDGKNKASIDQRSMMGAMIDGVGVEDRANAAVLAREAAELETAATSAQTAADDAHAAYDELSVQVANGDLDMKDAMDAALTTWQRAETAYNELSGAFTKKAEAAASKAKAWIDACMAAAPGITAEEMGHRLDQLIAERERLAQAIVEGLPEADMMTETTFEEEANEEAEAAQEPEDPAYTEADREHAAQAVAATAEAIAADEEVAQMTDEEIDAQIAQIAESENALPAAQAEAEEMGYDEETLAALAEQTEETTKGNAARREAIIRNQRNSFRSLSDRAKYAAEMGDTDAQAQLLEQRQAVQARLEALGATIEDPAANAPEPSTDTLTARATTEAKSESNTGAAKPAPLTENAPEPTTTTAPAKPVQKPDPRKERIRGRATDIATGTTKEQRDAAAAEAQAEANVGAMDVEAYIERRYPDADEEQKNHIRELYNAGVKAISNPAQTEGATQQKPAEAGDSRSEKKQLNNALRFAGQVKRRFGVNVEVVEPTHEKLALKDGQSASAAYDRETDTIYVSKNATQGDVIRAKVIHELTHRVEKTGAYKEFSDAVLKAYFKGNKQNENSMRNRIKARYQNMGVNLTAEGLEHELVAYATEKLIGGDQDMVNRIVSDSPSVARRVMDAIKNVLDKMKGVKDQEIDQLRKIEKMFKKALDEAQTKGQGAVSEENDSVQYSVDIPVDERDQTYFDNIDQHADIRIFQAVREAVPRYPKGGINLKEILKVVRENPLAKKVGTHTVVDCPDIGAEVELNADGIKHGYGTATSPNVSVQPDDFMMLNARAAMIIPDLLQTAVEVNRSKKYNEKGHDYGHVLLAVYSEKQRNKQIDYYAVRMIVEHNSDSAVYELVNFGVVGKLHAVNAKKIPLANVQQPNRKNRPLGGQLVSTYKIADLIKDVNKELGDTFSEAAYRKQGLDRKPTSFSTNLMYSIDDSALPDDEYLLAEIEEWKRGSGDIVSEPLTSKTGERQFATKTIQQNAYVPDHIKQTFLNDPTRREYSRESNMEQLARAWNRVQSEGYEGVRDRLLNQEGKFDTDDNADALVLMSTAMNDADMDTFMAIATKYNSEGTDQAKALQIRSMMRRMTPTGFAQKVVQDAGRKLDEHRAKHKAEDKKIDSESKKVVEDLDLKKKDGSSAEEQLKKTGSVRIDNKWGAPMNEQKLALIKEFGLEKVERPGDFYNWATVKQRMLEDILTTDNVFAKDSYGMNLVDRLIRMKYGQPVATKADIAYITEQMGIFNGLDDKNSREADMALSRAYEAQGNINQATGREKRRTWRYVSMLLSVASAGRNVIGNLAQMAPNAIADAAAVEMDRVISAVTGSERTRAHISAADRVKGWRAFAGETKNTFRDYFVDKTITQHGEGRYNQNQRGRVYETQVIETLRQMESLLMSVGDRNFWKKKFFNSLAEQQRIADMNGTEFNIDDAVEIAEAEANYATFNEDNAVRSVFNAAKNIPGIGTVLDYVMPFTGVPTNIIKRQFEFSPIGLGYTAIKHGLNALGGGDFDQRAFVDGMARGLTGTAMMGLGAMLLKDGSLKLGTKEEDDEKSYGVRTAQGDQYGVYFTIGDKNYSITTFSPAASALVAGAYVADAFGDNQRWYQALFNGTLKNVNEIFDASYMASIGDLLNTSNGKTVTDNLLPVIGAALTTQNIPVPISHLASSMDPYVRDTKDKDAMMEIVKTTMSKIPIAREWLPEKVDVAGRAVENTKHGVAAFIDPFTTSKVVGDPVLDEMIRLRDALVEAGENDPRGHMAADALSGRKNTLTQNKVTRTLTDEEKEAYRKRYGDLWRNGGTTYTKKGKRVTVQSAEELIGSRYYQRMSDAEKAEKLKEIVMAAKEGATYEIMNQI